MIGDREVFFGRSAYIVIWNQNYSELKKNVSIGKRLVVGEYLVENCLVPEASENSRVLAVVISCVWLLVLSFIF